MTRWMSYVSGGSCRPATARSRSADDESALRSSPSASRRGVQRAGASGRRGSPAAGRRAPRGRRRGRRARRRAPAAGASRPPRSRDGRRQTPPSCRRRLECRVGVHHVRHLDRCREPRSGCAVWSRRLVGGCRSRATCCQRVTPSRGQPLRRVERPAVEARQRLARAAGLEQRRNVGVKGSVGPLAGNGLSPGASRSRITRALAGHRPQDHRPRRPVRARRNTCCDLLRARQGDRQRRAGERRREHREAELSGRRDEGGREAGSCAVDSAGLSGRRTPDRRRRRPPASGRQLGREHELHAGRAGRRAARAPRSPRRCTVPAPSFASARPCLGATAASCAAGQRAATVAADAGTSRGRCGSSLRRTAIASPRASRASSPPRASANAGTQPVLARGLDERPTSSVCRSARAIAPSPPAATRRETRRGSLATSRRPSSPRSASPRADAARSRPAGDRERELARRPRLRR